MEVDMHAPPSSSTFRPVAFTVKRPRSPGSPTQERQTKRLSLAPVSVEGQFGRRPSTALGAATAASQDDWVRQARELSITSPLSVTPGFPPVLDGSATRVSQSRVDESMAIDDEGSQMRQLHPGSSSSRPWMTARSHLPLIHITTTPAQAPTSIFGVPHAPSPTPFSVLTESSASSTGSASSTSAVSIAQANMSMPHPCPPEIFLFPATPSDTPSHQHLFPVSEYGQPAVGAVSVLEPGVPMQNEILGQAPSQDNVEGSPRPSRLPDMPSSGRKHRIMMGPRADCTKCRTGVRGHWMHFD